MTARSFRLLFAQRGSSRKDTVALGAMTVVLAFASLSSATDLDLVATGRWPIDPPATIRSVAMGGVHAFLASGRDGLIVVDLSNPDAPRKVAGARTTGIADAVALAGTIACVGLANGGFDLIDISQPTVPVVVGHHGNGYFNAAHRIVVDGRFVYGTTSRIGVPDPAVDQSIIAVDIRDPASPELVANTYRLSDEATLSAFTAHQGFLYTIENHYVPFAICGFMDRLRMIDFQHKSGIPNVVNSWDDGSCVGIWDLEVVGGRLYALTAYYPGPQGMQSDVLLFPFGPWDNGNDVALAYTTTTPVAEIAASDSSRLFLREGDTIRILDIDSSGGAQPLGAIPLDDSLMDYGDPVAVAGSGACVVTRGLRFVDLADPVAPKVRGRLQEDSSSPIPGAAALDITIAGGLAYVANGYGGLQVLDASKPTAPAPIGRLLTQGDARTVAVEGNLACVGTTDGLETVDVRDPTTPRRLGHIPVEGLPTDVAMRGGIAYLALESSNGAPLSDGNAGLLVVDVRDPALPVELGRFSTLYSAGGLDVAQDHLYLAAAEFFVFDISEPGPPRLLNVPAFLGGMTSIVVREDLAYFPSNSVHAIDVSTPEAPIPHKFPLRTSFHTPLAIASGPQDLILVGTETGAVAMDVSNPEDPIRVGSAYFGAPVRSIAVEGNRAWLAGDTKGILVVELGVPSPMLVVAERDLDTAYRDPVGLALAGNHTWLCTMDAIVGFEVSTPSAPAPLGVYRPSRRYPWLRRISISGSIACVCGDGMDVVDLSNPETPIEIGRNEAFLTGLDIVIRSGHAYVAADFDGLMIFDVRDPSAPKLVAVHPTTPRSAHSLAFAGDRLCLASGGSLQPVDDRLEVLDVTQPAAPHVVGMLPGYFTRLAASSDGSVVFAGSKNENEDGTFVAVNLGDATKPAVLSTTPVGPTNPRVSGSGIVDIVAAANRLIISTADHGVVAFDVTDPASPRRLGACGAPFRPADLAIGGSNVYVNSEHGLVVLSLTDRSRPPRITAIRHEDGAATVTWPGSPGVVLQQSPSLEPGSWTDVPGSEGSDSAVVPSSDGHGFFRLRWTTR